MACSRGLQSCFDCVQFILLHYFHGEVMHWPVSLISSKVSAASFSQLLSPQTTQSVIQYFSASMHFPVNQVNQSVSQSTSHKSFSKLVSPWTAESVSQSLNQPQIIQSVQGSYNKLQPFFKAFSRTTSDFQGPPTRNTISQIVQKCTFASPTSLHFSVHFS